MKTIFVLSMLLAFANLQSQELNDSLALEMPAVKKKKKRKAAIEQADSVAIAGTEPADPCTQAVADARTDAANSDYLLKYTDAAPFRTEVADILYEDYHIRIVTDSKLQDSYCRCYDEEMENQLSAKFRFSVLARAEEKARQNNIKPMEPEPETDKDTTLQQ